MRDNRKETPWYRITFDRYGMLPIVVFVVIPLLIAYNAYYGRWVNSYALAAPYLALGLGYVLNKIAAGRRSERNFGHQEEKKLSSSISIPGCLRILAILIILELAGFRTFGFRWESDYSIISIFITIISAAVLALFGLFAICHALLRAICPRICTKCGVQKPRFRLECREKSVLAGNYCYEHFQEAVHFGLEKRREWFLLIDRPLERPMSAPLFSFYKADDMVEGSYPVVDIASVRLLIELAKPGVTEDTFAMRVPVEYVSPVSPQAEEPLLRCRERDVRFQPMTRAEFYEWFDRLLFQIDESGCEFRMNLPYYKTGVYIREDLG